MKDDGFLVKLVSFWTAVTMIAWMVAAPLSALAIIKLCSTYLWG